jgi:hypothetical protein
MRAVEHDDALRHIRCAGALAFPTTLLNPMKQKHIKLMFEKSVPVSSKVGRVAIAKKD